MSSKVKKLGVDYPPPAKRAWIACEMAAEQLRCHIDCEGTGKEQADRMLLTGFQQVMKITNDIEVKYFRNGVELTEGDIQPSTSGIVIMGMGKA